ncbi:MAG: hypothetical protein ACI4R5_07740 [Acetatifactor sp.]
MKNLLEVSEAKILRGNLIEILYRYYGTDISISVIRTALRVKGLVTDDELRKAIYYLGGEGKRYIHVEPAQKFGDSLIWLTPTGVNLAEGDLEDIGVIIDE